MGNLIVKRKAFTRKDGTKVKASSFKIKDRGRPGRGPKLIKLKPGVKTGWSKDLPQTTRLKRIVRASDGRKNLRGRKVQAIRRLNALANITTDRETERKARSDVRKLSGMIKR